MGDSAWASLTLYQCTDPKEVEAICAFIEEHLVYDPSGRMDKLQVWGDYTTDGTSMGFVDECESLAAKTPTSIWALFQDGYSGPGETAYHLPGLGVWRCLDSDGTPLFSLHDVKKILAANGQERDRLLGKPWLDVTGGMAAWLSAVPTEHLPVLKRPTVDEVEEWRPMNCRECHNDIPEIDTAAGHGFCGPCLHDALRSGWTPGD